MSEERERITGLAVVIMAAGKGTRLKSKRAKVLHEVGGKPLLGHVISAASEVVAPEHIYVVIGHEAERVRAAMAGTGVRFVEQREQRGTGHAIECAREAVAGYENVLVLSGDAPLIQPETILAVWRIHQAEGAAMTLLTAEPDEPLNYGRIIRVTPDSPEVMGIVEQKSLTPEQLPLREVNMGMYAFRSAPLFAHLNELGTNNAHGELYLTDMAGILYAAGERVVAYKTSEFAELLGANTIAELVALDATLRAGTAARLMAAGVTILKPETTVIDAEVEVGSDTVIEPYVQLLGRTKIGADCTIRSYTVVENCTLGEDVLVRQSCVLEGSTVAKACSAARCGARR